MHMRSHTVRHVSAHAVAAINDQAANTIVAQCMARPISMMIEAVAAANRGAEALVPLLQAAGISVQAGSRMHRL